MQVFLKSQIISSFAFRELYFHVHIYSKVQGSWHIRENTCLPICALTNTRFWKKTKKDDDAHISKKRRAPVVSSLQFFHCPTFHPPKNVSSPKVGLSSRMRNKKKTTKQSNWKQKQEMNPLSVLYVLEMTQSRSCWNITGNKGKELNVPTLPSSALHLLLWGAWCCRLKQPRQAEPTEAGTAFCFFFLFFLICFYLFKTLHRTWNRFFPLSISSNPLNPFLPLPNDSWAPPLFFCPLNAVRLFAKNSKAKKIIFFGYFIVHYRGFILLKKMKKRETNKQKFFGGIHNFCAAID